MRYRNLLYILCINILVVGLSSCSVAARVKRADKKYTIGDPLRIRIVRANLERKQLDFEIVE